MSITVKADLKALRRTAAQFSGFEQKIPQILSRSINRTVKRGQSRTVKLIAGEITAKQRDIRRKTKIRKKATRGDLEGKFGVLGLPENKSSKGRIGRLGLVKYRSSQLGSRPKTLKSVEAFGEKIKERKVSYWGVGYQISKSGGRKRIKGSSLDSPSPPFISTVPAGGSGTHRGVFRRRTRNPRSGIYELYGPSISHVAIKNPSTNKYWDRTLLNKEFIREVDGQISLAIQELMVKKYRRLRSLGR